MPVRDLTHPLSPETPVYPGDPPIHIDTHATLDADGYRVADVRLGSHAGTHVDAPAHTEPDGATLDAFSIERFDLDARLVDLTALGADGEVEAADLPETTADALVLRTGWGVRWGTDEYWDHPTLAPAAATWCARRGHDLGLDLPSPDPGTGYLPAHRRLLGEERLVVENLANLDGLPERFRLRVAPLALVGTDGAPVRAVAEW